MINEPDAQEFKSVKEKILAETAKIPWLELQRFFAQGSVLVLDADQDLVAVAIMFAEDNTEELEPLLQSLKLKQPSNDQARSWYENDAHVWSVVVAPYVLVQDVS